MQSTVSRRMLTLGRVGLASLFLLGAVIKMINFADTLARMDAAGMPFVSFLLPAAIALELVGGLMVACNLRFASVAAFVLAIYTLVINGVFHRFWVLEEPFRALELSLFFKNISIAGALLMIAAGAFSPHEPEEGRPS